MSAVKPFAKKTLAVLLCWSVCLSLCACNKSDSSESETVTETTASVDGIEPVTPEKPTYSFPQFLKNNADSISIYSNVVFNSFDSQTMNATVGEQPFKSVKCDMSFASGAYYRYYSEDKKGLVDAEGNVMLNAGYSQIVMIRPDAFLLTAEDGTESYAFIDENGIITTEGDGKNNWFMSETPLQLLATEATDNQPITYYLEAANGKVVYNKYWDYMESNNLDIPCTASYSAYLGDAYFYIVFDKYYNYKIYEGSYATVEVYAEGSYGSCFILDSDDYAEITSMLDSFGTSSKPKASPTTPNTDYVKFVFGNAKKSAVTISSDGFCYTEELSEDGVSYKYFSLLSEQCFADIIKWINTTLSKEYVK